VPHGEHPVSEEVMPGTPGQGLYPDFTQDQINYIETNMIRSRQMNKRTFSPKTVILVKINLIF